MTDGGRRTDFLCLALLIATATIFFSDVLFAGSNFYNRDLFPYHFPMKHVVREAMLSGEFPFWNRFYSGGQPLAANPAYELFYPLQWLILIGSYPFGFALHIVAHVDIALAGMYLLLRQMRLGVPASFFGALSFGMGGLLLGAIPTLPTFFVWALAPTVAWTILRLLQSPSAGRFAIAALIAGCQLLIGEPVAIAQVWLLIVIGSLVYARGAEVSIRRSVVRALLVGIAALTIAAVQIIPALDHARSSIRARGMPFSNVAEYSMPLARPLELVVPHLYGRFDPTLYAFWGAYSFDRRQPYLPSLYCGILIAIFVLAGWALRLRGTGLTISIAAFAYLLAIGNHTPLLRALYDLEIARGIRYPEKFAALAIVALIPFAATVADRLHKGDDRVRRAVTLAAMGVASVSAVPAIWTLTPSFTSSFLSFWRIPAGAAILAGYARNSWLAGFAIAAAAALLLWLYGRVQLRLWLLAVFALVIFDLFSIGNDLVVRMPASFFTPPPAAARLDRDRGAYSVFNRSAWMRTSDDFRKYQAVAPQWFIRNALQPFTPAAWGFRSNLELDFDETDLLPTHDLLDAMMQLGNSGFPRWGEAFAAIANVRTIVDLRPFDDVARESGGDLAVATPVRFTRMPRPERYYFAEEVVVAHGTAEVLGAMRRRIPIATAFVDVPVPTSASARILRTSESGNTAGLDVESSGPALLVATVTRHKYWRATIDGRPANILPANIAYQAVLVPAGRHSVRFRYSNPLVVAGAVISVVALLACAVAIALTRPRRRPRTGS